MGSPAQAGDAVQRMGGQLLMDISIREADSSDLDLVVLMTKKMVTELTKYGGRVVKESKESSDYFGGRKQCHQMNQCPPAYQTISAHVQVHSWETGCFEL